MRRRFSFSRGVFVSVAARAAVVGALGVGCATPSGETKEVAVAADNKPADDGAARITDESFDASRYTRRDLDLNKDGKADAYQFFVVNESGEMKVARKEVDLNFDGKIDFIRKMDDAGELVEERIDSDFDNRIDLVVAFQRGQIVQKTYDTNFDARPDLWRFFEKGAVVREEADLDYNDKVDYWEYFEGGKLDRVGVDRDGDGNVDEWQAAETG